MKKAIGVLSFAAVVLSCLMLSEQGFAQEAKKVSGRIDVYSEDMRFILKDVKSNGQVQYATWSPKKQDQKKNWIAQMELTADDWQELWMEFMPAGSGFVYIVVRGSMYPDIQTDRHAVLVDDVAVTGEGAEIQDGGFEDLDTSGNPTGWGLPAASSSQVSNLSHSGKYSLIVWHDSPAVQKMAVKAGVKYRINAWFKPY